MTKIDPWFLHQLQEIRGTNPKLESLAPSTITEDNCSTPSAWVSAMPVLPRCGTSEMAEERPTRSAIFAKSTISAPVYKRVDTCAAEFESYTPYLYSTYEEEDEATPTRSQESHHSRQRTKSHRAGN